MQPNTVQYQFPSTPCVPPSPVKKPLPNTSEKAISDPDSNIYIANLPADYGKNRLHTLFSPFGEIKRHKFVSPEIASQPGYGFVQFVDRISAQKAIKKLQNYTFPTGEVIYISLAMHRRSSLSDEPTNLYVQNIPDSWNNGILNSVFSKHGRVRQCKIVGGGIAFVRFDDHNQALNAIDCLNGANINKNKNKNAKNNKLIVRFATRKTAATAYQLQQIPSANKCNENNLYVRNLPKSYTQKDLHQLFKAFGTICAAKINQLQGVAFVRFVQAKDALCAIKGLNGSKPNGFEQEIVVKLAHFDIGDSRNRWSPKALKTTQNAQNTQISAVNINTQTVPNNTLQNVNMFNNFNMLNTVNPSLFPNMFSTNLSVPVSINQNQNQLSNMPYTFPINLLYPIGTQMAYILPPNLVQTNLLTNNNNINLTTPPPPSSSSFLAANLNYNITPPGPSSSCFIPLSVPQMVINNIDSKSQSC